MKPKLDPTPEQQAILEATTNSGTPLMINAYAGCGKTSTLEMVAAAVPTNVQGLALAFNVKIKKELERRFPSNFEVKTLNGLGHSAWSRAIGQRPRVEENKLGQLVTGTLKEAGFKASSEQWADIRRLVTLAMAAGLVPSPFTHFKGLVEDTEGAWASIAEDAYIEPDPIIIQFARDILIESIKLSFAGTISFDDQIYMSAMFGGAFPKFKLVLVDEAQDLSPLNHIQVRKCSTDRLIVVGDPKQAIYQFRGADSQSMKKLRGLRSEWVDLPLATTFRCPKAIVQRQREHAPGFTAFPSAPEGQVINWMDREALDGDGWTWDAVEELSGGTDKAAILCRNNAPLLSLALRLLRDRVSVVMLGRDIGKGLVALSKKILPDASTDRDTCLKLVNEWIDSERQTAIANEQEGKIAGIEDRGNCLIAVLESGDCKTAEDLRTSLQQLFARDAGQVVLSTGHRAKGLEWHTVLHLDPWRIPSKHARKAAQQGNRTQLEQELNLRYVIETRTQSNLILANLEHYAGGE